MRALRKITAWMLLCVLFLTLGGCTPSTKSDEEIIADVKTEFLSEEYPDCSLVSFDIENRATDSKNGTDTINAKLVIEKNNGIAEGILYLNINYKLYDNGWQLEKCARDAEDTKGIFYAKSAVDFSQEEIVSFLSEQYGLKDITVTAFSESTDLENEVQECSIEFTEKHTYVTYVTKKKFSRFFNPHSGEWKEIYPVSTEVISEDWDIEGTYLAQRKGVCHHCYGVGEMGDYDTHDYEVIFTERELTNYIPIIGKKGDSCYDLDGNLLRHLERTEGGTYRGENLEKLYKFSDFEVILSTNLFDGKNYRGSSVPSNESLAYMLANQGYEVRTNVDESIKYFTLYHDNNLFGLHNIFFFGPDYIGICTVSDEGVVKDDYNKTYTYNICELIPQN